MTTRPRIATRFITTSILTTSLALAVAMIPLGCGGEGSGPDATSIAARDLHVVEKSSYDMVLPVSGELAAQQQVHEIVVREVHQHIHAPGLTNRQT